MDDTELEIGACCPRCNSVVRKALTSTITNGIRRRYCECKQCGKKFFSVEMREECYRQLLDRSTPPPESTGLDPFRLSKPDYLPFP